jgi:hypothetical protein
MPEKHDLHEPWHLEGNGYWVALVRADNYPLLSEAGLCAEKGNRMETPDIDLKRALDQARVAKYEPILAERRKTYRIEQLEESIRRLEGRVGDLEARLRRAGL